MATIDIAKAPRTRSRSTSIRLSAKRQFREFANRLQIGTGFISKFDHGGFLVFFRQPLSRMGFNSNFS
ncbi:MAG: hypothetical protein ACI9B8_001088, partial [Sulfitobacter sp.]